MTLVTKQGKSCSQRVAPAPTGVAAAALALIAIMFCHAANAQQNSGSRSWTGFTTSVPEPPDWVRKTRPADAELYDRSRTVPAVEPDQAPLSPDELRKVEAEMNALRARHDRTAGRRNVAIGRSAAANPRKKIKITRPGCVLTCNIGLGTVTRK